MDVHDERRGSFLVSPFCRCGQAMTVQVKNGRHYFTRCPHWTEEQGSLPPAPATRPVRLAAFLR
jgi:hypothetical protein